MSSTPHANAKIHSQEAEFSSLWATFRNILIVVFLIFVFAVIQMLTLHHVCDVGMKSSDSLKRDGLPGLQQQALLREDLALFRLRAYEIVFAREAEKTQKTRAIQNAEKNVRNDIDLIKVHFPSENGRRLADGLGAAFEDLRLAFSEVRKLVDTDFVAAMKMLDDVIPLRVQQVGDAAAALERFGSATFTSEAGATFESFGEIKNNAIVFGIANIVVTFGAVVFVMLAARSARLQLSDALRRLKERTQELAASLSTVNATLESTADGILMIDMAGNIGNFNRQFLKMWRVAEPAGEPGQGELVMKITLPELNIPESFKRRMAELKAHPDHESFDVLDFPNGKVFECCSKPQIMNGQPVGRVWSFRDITERQRAEKEREQMEVQLRHAQKLESVGQLAAGIAHEINTPTQYVGDNLRFIQQSFDSFEAMCGQYSELLRAAKSNSVTPEIVEGIEKEIESRDIAYLIKEVPSAAREALEGVDRVSKIVRAMKEFSHPGSTEKAPADLNKAIETTVIVARNEWKHLADVKLDLDPALPSVTCYLSDFNQAILNLIINAAHAVGDAVKNRPDAKGLITISTRSEGNEIEVRISDTGCGIPEDIQHRIFEPFFTTKPVGKGTGQGLTVVYGSIVKRHGGTIKFESAVGKGTSFVIRLPAAPISGSVCVPKPAQ